MEIDCIWENVWPHLPVNLEYLTHWDRVTHICISKLPTILSDNGLSPGRRQAIIWTNAGILLIGPLGTNFSEIFIKIHIFSFKKMHLKVSSGNCQPFCLGLNVSNYVIFTYDRYSNVTSLVIPFTPACTDIDAMTWRAWFSGKPVRVG